ncbi:concanavalin A-like lectin/glucanase domain-containing protein [Cantharellus anzutake]|uniref:concanavalin A-like lectin/glucanase domain-containing protein n=1 Tax=Cantharellus anzutake TaxID=1750568 RepID=UPI001904B5DC|nr:concanavalin A-like lectin/glucanase domain-containing protein [Cantharellus anzutake]KAF8329333.1 concanavalin A-like lectin/glucanase domain-containing protein [Cantharellus anzutake]
MLASALLFLIAIFASFSPVYAGLSERIHQVVPQRRHHHRNLYGHPYKRSSVPPGPCGPKKGKNETRIVTPTTSSTAPKSTPSKPADNTTDTYQGHIAAQKNPKNGGTYKLIDMYNGNNFFDGFDFFNLRDPTHGLVNYLGRTDAMKKRLAYVDNGVVVMKVDDTTPGHKLRHGKRDSVRIATKKRYGGGLFVLDIGSMPYGDSVWPAFWTVGKGWPHNGEIDIIEGANLATRNQYTLHTGPGCAIDTSPSVLSEALIGNVGNKQCGSTKDSNEGCAFRDSEDTSYGTGLKNAGGGVFAMLWDSHAIRIWRFTPDNVPSDLKSQTPNPNSWDKKFLRAHWASSTCDIQKHFKGHAITFNIALCGDLADAAHKGGGAACAAVVRDPGNLKNAVWKINSLQVYQ